jgi:hypothetical protein
VVRHPIVVPTASTTAVVPTASTTAFAGTQNESAPEDHRDDEHDAGENPDCRRKPERAATAARLGGLARMVRR